MSRRLLVSVLSLLFLCNVARAGEPLDLLVIHQIKDEGFKRSEVMTTMSYLCDVIGPRLTGSSNLAEANQWCIDKLSEWGLDNARVEAWGAFGRGWELDRFSIEMTEPDYLNIIAHPQAWTRGTDSTISGTPVHIAVDTEEELARFAGQLAGAIVMLGQAREVEQRFEAEAKRYDDEKLAEIEQAPEPGRKSKWADRWAAYRKRRALNQRIKKMLRQEGAAVILEPSRGAHGTLFVAGGGSREIDAEPALPALTVSAEHYARMARLLELEESVKLEISVQARYLDDDSLAYNVLAEIPGADRKLKKEVVMLGGHLDSWHAGTGATDNAAGCAVAMEAVRILKAIDAKPRRTIRLALWSGEEQGLLGSKGYVKKHFGDTKTMELKSEHERLSCYFNLDNGTGKIRGIYAQGNDAVKPIFERWLEPFHDLGAETVTIRNTGGTDHLPFERIGLPGFQFIQDPIAYSTRTHHTSMDVYDHTLKGDLMQASVIMASFVFHAANRDELLPRKPLPKVKEKKQTARK